jgi:outer membrane protein
MHHWLQTVAAVAVGGALLAPSVAGAAKKDPPPSSQGATMAHSAEGAGEERFDRAAVSDGGRAPGAPPVSGPISLAEAVRIAVSRHPSVEAARAAARAANAAVRTKRSSQKLLITASQLASAATSPVLYSAPVPSEPVGLGGVSPFAYGWPVPDVPHYGQNLMLVMPLYTGGRANAELRSAVAMREAAEAQTASTEQEIALRTKEAYHGVLLAQGVAEVRKNQLQEEEGRLKELEERYRTDGVALYEVLRHRAELAAARQQYTNAQRDLEIALLDLKTALGLPQEADLQPSDRLAFVPIQTTLAEQQSVADRQSPEMAAAEARCKAADETLKAAKRASRLNLYACAVQTNGVNHGLPNVDSSFFGFCTYLPLFDSGMRRANTELAESRVLEVKSSCEDAKLKVKRDVTAAWLTLQAAADNVHVSEAAAAEAEESYHALQLRYEARRATQAELLDALDAVVRARLNRVQSLYDYNVARARLDRAVGRV